MFRKLLLAVPLLAGLLLTAAPVEARPSRSSLTIQSTPAKASVLLDGAPAGRTPLTLKNVPPGEHTLVFSKPGYETVTKEIVYEGGKSKVRVRLKKTPKLSDEERAARAGILRREIGNVRELRSILGAALYGTSLSGQALQDPFTGYYVSISTGFDGQNRPTLTIAFYLNKQLTQSAGSMTVALSAFASEADYQFTAGRLAGASGHLSAAPAGLTGYLIDGSGTMSDGSEWTALLQVTLGDEGVSITGTASVTPDGGTPSEWALTVEPVASVATITTPEGFTIVFNSQDGVSSGTLSQPESGVVLATFYLDKNGDLVVVFSDGRRQVIDLS
ncbi:MAG: PEGA domain-containing protein [Armatimonadota bacterium]